MKMKSLFYIILTFAGIIIVLYAFQGGTSPEAYVAQIEKERAEKDIFMKQSADSPFADHRESFKGLNYYKPDPQYRINAHLIQIKNKKMIQLPASDGGTSQYLEYGYAEFEIHDKKQRLLIFEVVDSGPSKGTLFLAFADETSANTTYGAGRYVDVRKVPGSTSITIDFNKAYNPYCAYSESYSCPLPPRDNLLSVPIEAGEKIYP